MRVIAVLTTFLLLFTFVLKLKGQCIANAGDDFTFCDYDMDSTNLGGNPSVMGGNPPYTYKWTTSWSFWTLYYTASDFLDDTTTANPKIVDFPRDTFLLFHLFVTDSSGNICSDSVVVRVSSYSWTLEDKRRYINQGDSVMIYPGIFGGIPPLAYQWSPSTGLSQPNEANTWAKPDTSTIYALLVTDSIGCIGGDGFVVYVTPVGVIERITLPDISVYPNPAKDYLNIESVDDDGHFSIFDLFGREIFEAKIQRGKNILNLGGLPDGVYTFGTTGSLKIDKLVIMQ